MENVFKFLGSMLLGWLFFAPCGHAAVSAQAGHLDLKKWNFARGDSTFLQGDWEFYWSELLTPDEARQRAAPQYFPMPAT